MTGTGLAWRGIFDLLTASERGHSVGMEKLVMTGGGFIRF